MAGVKKNARKRVLWLATDVKELRRAAGKITVKRLAKQLKRSESAIRFKAHTLKLSLALR